MSSHPPAELTVQAPHWYRVPVPEESPAGVPLRLVLEPGNRVFVVTCPEVVIGRHTDVDLRLPLPDVSRRHCRVAAAGDGWHVYDLESLNGVYVNGERVRHAALHQGDRLGIGGFTFRVDLSDGPAPTPGAQVLRSIAEALPAGEGS